MDVILSQPQIPEAKTVFTNFGLMRNNLGFLTLIQRLYDPTMLLTFGHMWADLNSTTTLPIITIKEIKGQTVRPVTATSVVGAVQLSVEMGSGLAIDFIYPDTGKNGTIKLHYRLNGEIHTDFNFMRKVVCSSEFREQLRIVKASHT